MKQRTRFVVFICLLWLVFGIASGDLSKILDKAAELPSFASKVKEGKTTPNLSKEAKEAEVARVLRLTDKRSLELVYGKLKEVIAAGALEETHDERANRVTKDAYRKSKGQLTNLSAEELNKFYSDLVISKSDRSAEERVSKALTETYEIYKSFAPELSNYKAKQLIISALEVGWPDGRGRFKFPPKERMSGIRNAPSVPEVDESADWLLALKDKDYWWDKDYNNLLSIDPDELRDSYIMPLFELTQVDIPPADRRDMGRNYPQDVLARYGDRVCGGLIDFLSHPARYDAKFKGIPYELLRLGNDCFPSIKKKILKAAFRSGWNKAEQYLPGNEEWADELIDGFEDSPYGKPTAYPMYRPLTAAEKSSAQDAYQELMAKFEATRANDPLKDADIFLRLVKEFDPKAQKVRTHYRKMTTEFQSQLYAEKYRRK